MGESSHTHHHPVSAGGAQKKQKIVSAQAAVDLIHDGDTIATGGFVGIGFAEELAIALEKRFVETQSPKNLTLVYAAGQGDGKDKGLNHLGHEGLVGKVIGGHWGLVPKLQKLANENKIEAYNLPQGCITHLFRDIAAGKPGSISSVGKGTFVDPKNGGGKLNSVTKEDIVDTINIGGEDYLFYKAFPINVALIRGTTADADGNITMEREALTLEALALATAARNSGGLVIVQVERVAERGSLNSRQVKIPGIMVDCVVVAKPENHWQTFADPYNAAFAGEIKVPVESVAPMELDARKVIARRAAFELKPNSVVNLGIGMPEGVSNVANEEKVIDLITLTAEPGVIGGIPAGGLNFGAGVNCQAIIDQPYQFDFYDGGGLDTAFLGMAELDQHGNVNVSKFGPKVAGAGGFINISQNAKEVVFMGTFLAGKPKITIGNGTINVEDGECANKMVKQVEHITFSGIEATKSGQKVLYVTERCVFKLVPEGVELIEIAPGLDLQKDILDHMDFEPLMNEQFKLMDERIFTDDPMNLEEELTNIPLTERIHYVEKNNELFVNLENLKIKEIEQVHELEHIVSDECERIGQPVYAIINYDNFAIAPDLMEDYLTMIQHLHNQYYIDVTRYTTSAFIRKKLGDAMSCRGIAPHIYEKFTSAEEALNPHQ